MLYPLAVAHKTTLLSHFNVAFGKKDAVNLSFLPEKKRKSSMCHARNGTDKKKRVHTAKQPLRENVHTDRHKHMGRYTLTHTRSAKICFN